ncbi:MAG: STAS domain-containing protein [Actinomycetota bacterium]|nr:STAS domain-containing protein [Actinomycetota bacterium]
MPHSDQTLARADTLPPAFACTATHGGVDAAWVHVVGELDIATAPELARTLHESHQRAHLTVLDLRELAFMDSAGVHAIVNASLRARKDGRRLVLVRGRPEIYRMFTLTGSTADVDIGDLDPVPPPVEALQRSLVSQSLLRTGGTARHRGASH